MDELLNIRVLAHHALEYGPLSLVAELPAPELHLSLGKEAVVTVIVLVLGVRGYVVEQTVIAADGYAAV